MVILEHANRIWERGISLVEKVQWYGLKEVGVYGKVYEDSKYVERLWMRIEEVITVAAMKPLCLLKQNLDRPR